MSAPYSVQREAMLRLRADPAIEARRLAANVAAMARLNADPAFRRERAQGLAELYARRCDSCGRKHCARNPVTYREAAGTTALLCRACGGAA